MDDTVLTAATIIIYNMNVIVAICSIETYTCGDQRRQSVLPPWRARARCLPCRGRKAQFLFRR